MNLVLPSWTLFLFLPPGWSGESNPPPAPRIITQDLVLEKAAVLRQPLVIEASHITIDGQGASLQGPGQPGDLKSFSGVGILARGCSDVTVKNLKVRGFESALEASDGEGWRIEGNDFSGNYHDPDFGWGEGRQNGGIILTRLHRSVIRDNKANQDWNGLELIESHDNLIAGNDFSRCSNVCLKLWTSCRNRVIDNNLSYGLRIKPGEVHARDSTSVLIESGSNDNYFYRNDITHGGDGLFIRILNGWVSIGNLFVVKIQPSGGRNLLVGVPFSEARWTWMEVVVPLAGDPDWTREEKGGADLAKIDALSLSLDSWGGDPFTVWIDGLSFE